MKLKVCLLLLLIFFIGCGLLKDNTTPLEYSSSTISWPDYNIETFNLKNGVKFYLIKNSEVPLIHVKILIKAGKVQEPVDKKGIFDILVDSLIGGGSKRYPGEKFGLLFEEHGADFDISFKDVYGEITLTCLKQDFELLMNAVIDLLTHPLLPKKEVALAKQLEKNEIYKRNDSPLEIAIRHFRCLIYGAESVYAIYPTYKSVDRVTRKDLMIMAHSIFKGRNLLVAVEGDFRSLNIKKILKDQFLKLESGKENRLIFPPVKYSFKEQVYFIDKPGLDQATVIMGHLGGFRSDPNFPAIQVFNMVLSYGFSSKLFQEIRTKRGLVYSIFGRYGCRYFYPGIFYIIFQTANGNVQKAIRSVKNVLISMKRDITKEDVKQAKECFFNSLVFRYDHPIKILDRRLYYEYRHMDKDSFKKLIESIKNVKVKDIKSIANSYIKPDKMIVLIIGDKRNLKEQFLKLNAKELMVD